MKPEIWGKYFWTTLHLTALGYPDKPTIDNVDTYRSFYINFGKILPCQKCSINYVRHLTDLPIDKYLKNSLSLFAWTILLHNEVNKEHGKPQWDLEYARMHYMNLTPISDTAMANHTRMFLCCVGAVNVFVLIVVVWTFVKYMGRK